MKFNFTGNNKYIEYLLLPFVVIGTYPLVSEINEETKPFFSENYIKWIVIFGIFYTKTEDIQYSILVSVLTILFFPSIFFGEKTYYKELV